MDHRQETKWKGVESERADEVEWMAKRTMNENDRFEGSKKPHEYKSIQSRPRLHSLTSLRQAAVDVIIVIRLGSQNRRLAT